VERPPQDRIYDRDRDRKPLLNAVREQFLLNRLVAASQAENTRNLGLHILFNRMEHMSDKVLLKRLHILFNRMEHMSDKVLLKTIRKLGKSGALDLAIITGKPIPGKPSSYARKLVTA
jgi:hypothetical protein